MPGEEARQQNLRFQGQYLDRDTGLHYNTFNNIGNIEVINMNGSTMSEIYSVAASEIIRNDGWAIDGGSTSNIKSPPGTWDSFNDSNWIDVESKSNQDLKESAGKGEFIWVIGQANLGEMMKLLIGFIVFGNLAICVLL